MSLTEPERESLRCYVPCPSCGCQDSAVTDSRWSKCVNGRRRRRKCTACGCSFTTVEVLYVDQPPATESRPLTRLPPFVQQIKGQVCKHCNGEGVIRKGRRLAYVLETFRKECGKKRVDVAKAIGMSPEGLEKLEKGQRTWSPERIQQFLIACSK